MTIPADLVEFVRQRANAACEYCGVAEVDCGGELTIDHFRPQTRGGTDDPINLLYCCYRCNLYKGDYWPAQQSDPVLWNPRGGPANDHWLMLANGALHGLTPIGVFTIKRLRLNRAPLLTYRVRRSAAAEERQLLQRYRELVASLEQLREQQFALLMEHGSLLAHQRELLKLLIGREE